MIKFLLSIKRPCFIYFFIAFLFVSVQAQEVEKVLYKQTGSASFYNKRFQGRKTSSGERLDNDRYTAAHSSIPFGTLVRVTNEKNGKSVIVKINDRFSARKGHHLIDLTYSAAKEIDIVRLGIAKVTLEVLTITETEAEKEAIIPPDTITYKIYSKSYYCPAVRPTDVIPLRDDIRFLNLK